LAYPEFFQLTCKFRRRVVAAAVAVEYRTFRQIQVPAAILIAAVISGVL
jgi:hypothetical protein